VIAHRGAPVRAESCNWSPGSALPMLNLAHFLDHCLEGAGPGMVGMLAGRCRPHRPRDV